MAEQREEAEQAERPRVGRDQIDPRGLPHLGALLLGADQEEGGERHQLPRDQEQDRVARQDDRHHRRRHDPPPQTQPAAVGAVLRVAPIARAVERSERGDRAGSGSGRARRVRRARRPGGRPAALRAAAICVSLSARVDDETREADGGADQVQRGRGPLPPARMRRREAPGSPAQPDAQRCGQLDCDRRGHRRHLTPEPARRVLTIRGTARGSRRSGTAMRAARRASAGRTSGTAGSRPCWTARSGIKLRRNPAQSGARTPSITCSGTLEWKLRAGGNSSVRDSVARARPKQPAVEPHEDLRERGRRVRHRRAGPRVAAVPGDRLRRRPALRASAQDQRACEHARDERGVRSPSAEPTARARREMAAASPAGPSCSTTRSRAGITRAGSAPIPMQPSASRRIASSMLGGDSCARAAPSERLGPRNTLPNTFTKQAIASAPAIASSGAASGATDHTPSIPSAVDPQQTEVDQQLAHEAVERRQAADRRGADREQRRGAGHRPGEPAETIDLARAGAVDHGSGGQEQQRLEERVVPDVEQTPAQTEGDPGRLLRADTDQRQAQTHHDDSDVLDAVIGEQTLEIVLAERERERRRRRCRRRLRAAAGRAPPAAWAAASGSAAVRRSPS